MTKGRQIEIGQSFTYDAKHNPMLSQYNGETVMVQKINLYNGEEVYYVSLNNGGTMFADADELVDIPAPPVPFRVKTLWSFVSKNYGRSEYDTEEAALEAYDLLKGTNLVKITTEHYDRKHS